LPLSEDLLHANRFATFRREPNLQMRGKEPTFLAHNRSSHWQPLAEKDQLRAYVDKPTLTYMSNWACERPHKNSSQHPCIEDAPLPLKLFAFANGLVDLGPFL